MTLPFSTNSDALITSASAPPIPPPLYRNPGTITHIRSTINAALGIVGKSPGGALVAVLIVGLELLNLDNSDFFVSSFPLSLCSKSFSICSKVTFGCFDSDVSAMLGVFEWP
jgi:hypothetical protein